MANRITNWMSNVIQKLNPAQQWIARQEGSRISTDQIITVPQSYEKIEIVTRGVSLVVNACCSFDYDIKDKVTDGLVPGIKAKSVDKLMNYRPNPYQSIQSFRKAIFTDIILEGNAFIYWDGAFLYHLPAAQMVILPDPKTYINSYMYMGVQQFGPDEVFMFSDISNDSIYRGKSRLNSAIKSINTLYKMHEFQQSFFENGAVPGIVLETENTLSQAAKDRTLARWTSSYNPKNGARKPMIVDNGLKLKSLFDINFQDLEFDAAIQTHSNKILTALGVPTILLEGGNNANIAPNLRLFYLETVLPIINRFTSEVERYFGFDTEPITATISALQPDIKDIAAYHVALVNGGIETPAEAREELRLPTIAGQGLDKIRVPQNIAGSAVNPTVGGAPKKPTEGE